MNTQQMPGVYKWLRGKIPPCWQSFLQREDGAHLVLMAVVITVLLGFAGLLVDGSNLYYQSQRIQIAADAAALGGARLLANHASHDEISAEIEALALANDAEVVTWYYINNQRGVHVETARTFDAFFARIYGHDVFTVSAEASAQFEFVTGAGGLMPFTVECNCDDGEGGGSGNGGGDNGGDDGGSGDDGGDNGGNDGGGDDSGGGVGNPGDDISSPTSGTIEVDDKKTSSYGIRFVGRTGNTWSYEVNEIEGHHLSYWLLNIPSCMNKIVGSTPNGTIGTDSNSQRQGIKWSVNGSFTSGTFSFTLDDNYPAGTVEALASPGSSYGTVGIRGPICDGTNTGEPGASTGTNLCLPVLDFETDTAGAALVAGQIIDTEWAAWGVRVTTNSPGNHPAMIFNTANPTGNDHDLGTPNQAFGGPGIGAGGGNGMPGRNNVPLGKVLIVAENTNSANPDDNANGGTLIFTFDYSVRIDDLKILDIDDSSAAGTIRAYSDKDGSKLVATAKMLGLGDNSVQNVALNALGVRRLEVQFPKSGALASVVSCRTGSQVAYSIGNLIWSDTNKNNVQDAGEPGIGGVVLQLYASGQEYVIAETTTNAGGEYQFDALPAGSYEIKIAPSNFNAGGALYGLSYSVANSGSDDNIDSDFSPSTGKAAVTISNADITNVDGGFYPNTPVDTGAQSAVIVVKDNKNSQYEVSLQSIQGNTWTYFVREVSGRDLSYWTLGIGNCLNHIVSTEPSSNFSKVTSASANNIVGAKWTVNNQFKSGPFSVTLDGAYAVRPQKVLVMSNASAEVTITGPDCSIPAETPPTIPEPENTPEPDPAPESPSEPDDSNPDPGDGAECDCSNGGGFVYGKEYTLHEPVHNAPGNVGWIRWEGDTPSAKTLEDNIRYPQDSPVINIGDWLKGTTGMKTSVFPTLEELWLGKQVLVPIYDQVKGNGSNAQYRICGFAVFELTGVSKQDKTITGKFIRSVVRGDETDVNGPDFGARDVRLVH
jgi:Flp pilus assembly protein TadG